VAGVVALQAVSKAKASRICWATHDADGRAVTTVRHLSPSNHE